METINDIVDDIRAQNQGLPEDGYALSPLVADLLGLADRIEAAIKREREATCKESLQVGNAAAIREAAAEFVSVILDKKPGIHNLHRLAEKCRDALAKPPRNCDVGTAEEQDKRFTYQFCRVGIEGCVRCKLNTLKHRGNTCGIHWAQMPHTKAR